MFHSPVPVPSVALADLANFMVADAEALVSAAALLGDRPAVQRTARLIEDISEAARLTPRLRRELVALHRLLSLHAVDEPDSIEAARFAMIDPASPAVEEICLLTDRLRTRMAALVDEDDRGGLLQSELANAA